MKFQEYKTQQKGGYKRKYNKIHSRSNGKSDGRDGL